MTDEQRLEDSLNFGWVIDDQVAACAAPVFDSDIEYLKSQRVRALVRLAHPETDAIVIAQDRVRRTGLEDLHEPVRDFKPPSESQITRILRFVDAQLKRGNPVAISCGAGCGRTGTIIACLLITRGYTAEDALDFLISKRPCSKEILERTPSQHQAILNFQRRRLDSEERRRAATEIARLEVEAVPEPDSLRGDPDTIYDLGEENGGAT